MSVAGPDNNSHQQKSCRKGQRGFTPGISGNPGGRPKTSLRLHLAQYGEAKNGDAAKRLAKAAWEYSIGGDVKWAEWLALRLLGNEPQAAQLSGPNGEPLNQPSPALAALAAAMLKQTPDALDRIIEATK